MLWCFPCVQHQGVDHSLAQILFVMLSSSTSVVIPLEARQPRYRYTAWTVIDVQQVFTILQNFHTMHFVIQFEIQICYEDQTAI